jgi:hypothetical protein
MKYLRIVLTDDFSASATRLMNFAAPTSASDSAHAHTILSDAVFLKGHDSIELQMPLAAKTNCALRGKPEEFFRLGQR